MDHHVTILLSFFPFVCVLFAFCCLVTTAKISVKIDESYEYSSNIEKRIGSNNTSIENETYEYSSNIEKLINAPKIIIEAKTIIKEAPKNIIEEAPKIIIEAKNTIEEASIKEAPKNTIEEAPIKEAPKNTIEAKTTIEEAPKIIIEAKTTIEEAPKNTIKTKNTIEEASIKEAPKNMIKTKNIDDEIIKAEKVKKKEIETVIPKIKTNKGKITEKRLKTENKQHNEIEIIKEKEIPSKMIKKNDKRKQQDAKELLNNNKRKIEDENTMISKNEIIQKEIALFKEKSLLQASLFDQKMNKKLQIAKTVQQEFINKARMEVEMKKMEKRSKKELKSKVNEPKKIDNNKIKDDEPKPSKTMPPGIFNKRRIPVKKTNADVFMDEMLKLPEKKNHEFKIKRNRSRSKSPERISSPIYNSPIFADFSPDSPKKNQSSRDPRQQQPSLQHHPRQQQYPPRQQQQDPHRQQQHDPPPQQQQDPRRHQQQDPPRQQQDPRRHQQQDPRRHQQQDPPRQQQQDPRRHHDPHPFAIKQSHYNDSKKSFPVQAPVKSFYQQEQQPSFSQPFFQQSFQPQPAFQMSFPPQSFSFQQPPHFQQQQLQQPPLFQQQPPFSHQPLFQQQPFQQQQPLFQQQQPFQQQPPFQQQAPFQQLQQQQQPPSFPQQQSISSPKKVSIDQKEQPPPPPPRKILSKEEQRANFCRERDFYSARFDKDWNFNCYDFENRKLMQSTAYYTINTLDARTGNVICSTCDVIMEIGMFDLHTKRFSHSSYKKITEENISCDQCGKKLHIDAWHDHLKHNQFSYEYLNGFKQCVQCGQVIKEADSDVHYDMHYQKNSLLDINKTRGWNQTKNKWLGNEKKKEEEKPKTKEKEDESSFVIDDEPLICISHGKSQIQNVFASRLYYPCDNYLNTIPIAKNLQIAMAQIDNVVIPIKNSSDKIDYDDIRCLICNDLLILWNAKHPNSGSEFAFLDVVPINGGTFYAHSRCVLTNNKKNEL